MGGTSGANNLCLSNDEGEWLVPELLIIGAIKAATTTFCRSLSYSPGVKFPTHVAELDLDEWPAAWKEGHFFDQSNLYNADYNLMLSDYGKCDRSVRHVAVDGSARYAVDHQVPEKIKLWYGYKSQQVKFVLLMRDPVARLHSHYWHGKECKWCSWFYRASFQQLVTSILTNGPLYFTGGVRLVGADRGCGDFVEASIYTNQIRMWFSHFESHQFLFIPMKFITSPGRDGRILASPAKDIWAALGLRGLTPPPSLISNSRPHPELYDDLSPKAVVDLKKFFDRVTSPHMIAQLLIGTEARLYGFVPLPQQLESTTNQIAKWIAHNW